MVKSIRYSSFMLNRFRLMERIMKEIRLSEERTGKRQSAILLLDLDGMYFHTGLISFITGPYRIMWGTLVEQYPSFLSAIVCFNCTPAMRTLWNACTPFLGDEYRQKVYLLGQENDWREKLPLLELSIPLEAFPKDYGGEREFKIREPKPYQTPILELSPKDLLELEELKIPAGEFLLKTYFLEKCERLHFVLSHERELTINILYSEKRKTIRREQITKIFKLEEVDDLCEVYAGCERPGLPGIDFWNWIVPKTGFFHLIFGNEKAWILPVTLKFQIFRKQDEKRYQQTNSLQPIPEECLGNEFLENRNENNEIKN
uniref:CRAL-TRIO domain-containing protein n=1 Tax=Meloidogyne enterolobii TaxID=390850 RepID=A0A6V7VCI2_MELEN|nr:unnamed protein product [Meloidogyne enterolobii]